MKMNIKVMLSGTGLARASTERWRRATQRRNRIHIPLDGKALYHDVKADYLLSPGNAYLMVNSSASDLEMLPDTGYNHLYLDFQTVPPLLNREILIIDLGKDTIFMHLTGAIQALLQENLQANHHNSLLEGRDDEMFRQVQELLKVVIMHLHRVYQISAIDNNNVERAINFINEHYAEQIRNETIAEELHIDTRYLIRLFSKHVGTPPYQYLTQCRIEHGYEFLRNGKNVTETAYLCGYQSENAFRIAFKRIMGRSPKTVLKKKS